MLLECALHPMLKEMALMQNVHEISYSFDVRTCMIHNDKQDRLSQKYSKLVLHFDISFFLSIFLIDVCNF